MTAVYVYICTVMCLFVRRVVILTEAYFCVLWIFRDINKYDDDDDDDDDDAVIQ